VNIHTRFCDGCAGRIRLAYGENSDEPSFYGTVGAAYTSVTLVSEVQQACGLMFARDQPAHKRELILDRLGLAVIGACRKLEDTLLR